MRSSPRTARKLHRADANNFQTGPKLPDLYNECNKVTPRNLAEVDLNKVPVVEIDKDGEVVTGFMVADNYFELYINGKLIGVDATPFTPFNSHVVRFRVKRPYTIAVLAQDWEDKLGLGMEVFHGNTWHSGDGGFVAKFSDGTVTNSSWKAQSFYIAPLAHPDDVVEYGNIHDTSHLGRIHPLAKLPTCRELCFAIHYPIPDGWTEPDFDDSNWPQAFEYLDQEVGIVGVPGYWRFPEAFLGAAGSGRSTWCSTTRCCCARPCGSARRCRVGKGAVHDRIAWAKSCVRRAHAIGRWRFCPPYACYECRTTPYRLAITTW